MEQLNVKHPDERAYMFDDPELGIAKTDPERKHWSRMINRYNKCIALAAVRGGAWLDVACGSGYGTEIVSAVADHATGVDIDTNTIVYAKKHHRRKDNIEFINQDIADLAVLKERSFDAILSIETIEHLRDAGPFLKSVRRLLKPGGVFVVTTPESQCGGGQNPYNNFHVREYTYDQFYTLLSGHFKSVAMETEKAVLTTGIETVQIYAVCH